MTLLAVHPEPSAEEETLSDVKQDFPSGPSGVAEGETMENLESQIDSREPHNQENLPHGTLSNQDILVDLTPDTSSLSNSPPVDHSLINMITTLDTPLIDRLLDNVSNEISNGNDLVLPIVSTSEIKNHSEHDCLLHPNHLSTMDRLQASKNTIASLHETIER